MNAKRILRTIDQTALNQLREKYPRNPESPKINRFEDANYWVAINLKRVQDLWLDRTEPLRILDLGCGSGFFLYICKLFGHDVIGLDRDTNPLFRGTTELLGIPRLAADIEPFVPLPHFGEQFDLITAYRICFQRVRTSKKGEWQEWGADEWKFFVEDVRSRLMKPEGRLLLDFNPRDDGSYFDLPVLRYFQSAGARFFRSKVLLAADPNQRPVFMQLKRTVGLQSERTSARL